VPIENVWGVRRWDETMNLEGTGKQFEAKHLTEAKCIHCKKPLKSKMKRHEVMDTGYMYMTNYYCPKCKIDYFVR
jgi:hypothetical protein